MYDVQTRKNANPGGGGGWGATHEPTIQKLYGVCVCVWGGGMHW